METRNVNILLDNNTPEWRAPFTKNPACSSWPSWMRFLCGVCRRHLSASELPYYVDSEMLVAGSLGSPYKTNSDGNGSRDGNKQGTTNHGLRGDNHLLSKTQGIHIGIGIGIGIGIRTHTHLSLIHI